MSIRHFAKTWHRCLRRAPKAVAPGLKVHKGRFPVELNGNPAAIENPQCQEWYAILDSIFRLLNQMGTAIAVNAFHGTSRAEWCSRSKEHRDICKRDFVPGGTGCLSN